MFMIITVLSVYLNNYITDNMTAQNNITTNYISTGNQLKQVQQGADEGISALC